MGKGQGRHSWTSIGLHIHEARQVYRAMNSGSVVYIIYIYIYIYIIIIIQEVGE